MSTLYRLSLSGVVHYYLLRKVLRRYSDKTAAQDLVQELESYSGDPSNIMLSGKWKAVNLVCLAFL